MRHFLFLLILGFFQMMPQAQAAKPASLTASGGSGALQVGVAAAVRGNVEIEKTGRVGRVISSGEPIFLGDTVKTDSESRLQILLRDETVFTIGPNSAIVIDEFVYDPNTQDGKVNAKAVKGLFRLVTGKIAKKKPENVKVKLPVGTIGIRGTIVVFEVADQDTLAVLFGPGDQNNTGDSEGSFILGPEGYDPSDPGQGEQGTKVDETGSGATIDESGNISPPFEVPGDTLQRLNQGLSAPKDQKKSNAGSGSGSGDDSGDEGEDEGEGDDESAGEQSGQDDVDADEDLGDTGDLFDDLDDLDDALDDAAQDEADEDAGEIEDGPTSFDELQAEAEQNSGKFHFSQSGVPLETNGSSDGSYLFKMDINFGDRTVGGGMSRLDISNNFLLDGVSGNTVFSIPEENFGGLSGQDDAFFAFDFTDPGTNCMPDDCEVSLDVILENEGGEIAVLAAHDVVVDDPNDNHDDAVGGDVADRFSGSAA